MIRLVRPIAVVALLAAGASSLLAHDLFIKLDTYFLRPGTAVTVPILSGTFSSSENSIERDRIADLSLVTPAGRGRVDLTALSARRDSTFLALRLAGSGTYVVGMSLDPTEITLEGKEFTAYLEEEAIRNVLARRDKVGTSARPAHERYAKHVKAVFQVGRDRTDGWATALGYPAEIVPLVNPYALKVGGTLQVRCIADGAPAAGQMVLTGGRRNDGSRIRAREFRADDDGVVSVPLDTRGRWYVKFVRMTQLGDQAEDYRSEWATLTFQIR